MVDRLIVERLCASIEEYLKELEQADDIDWDLYVRDNRSRRFVERMLQVTVEAMIDLGQHIIADEGFEEPESYRAVFRILADHGIIPRAVLTRYEQIASFRNVLVHHYEKLDDAVVFGIFKTRLEDVRKYVGYVLTWLSTHEPL